jgi:hypothetical protein
MSGCVRQGSAIEAKTAAMAACALLRVAMLCRRHKE